MTRSLYVTTNLQETHRTKKQAELHHETIISKIQTVGNSTDQMIGELRQLNFKGENRE